MLGDSSPQQLVPARLASVKVVSKVYEATRLLRKLKCHTHPRPLVETPSIARNSRQLHAMDRNTITRQSHGACTETRTLHSPLSLVRTLHPLRLHTVSTVAIQANVLVDPHQGARPANHNNCVVASNDVLAQRGNYEHRIPVARKEAHSRAIETLDEVVRGPLPVPKGHLQPNDATNVSTRAPIILATAFTINTRTPIHGNVAYIRWAVLPVPFTTGVVLAVRNPILIQVIIVALGHLAVATCIQKCHFPIVGSIRHSTPLHQHDTGGHQHYSTDGPPHGRCARG